MATSTIKAPDIRTVTYKTTSGAFPSDAELVDAISKSGGKGVILFQFTGGAAEYLYSIMLYQSMDGSYGSGLMFSYYDTNFYKVKNANGTITRTAF